MIMFSIEDCRNISAILESKEHVAIRCNTEIRRISFNSEDGGTVLEIIFTEHYRIAVESISLRNQRVETMTQLFEYLIYFCKTNQVAQIQILSVMTVPMANWVMSHGFHPVPNGYKFEIEDGVFGGDFTYDTRNRSLEAKKLELFKRIDESHPSFKFLCGVCTSWLMWSLMRALGV